MQLLHFSLSLHECLWVVGGRLTVLTLESQVVSKEPGASRWSTWAQAAITRQKPPCTAASQQSFSCQTVQCTKYTSGGNRCNAAGTCAVGCRDCLAPWYMVAPFIPWYKTFLTPHQPVSLYSMIALSSIPATN